MTSWAPGRDLATIATPEDFAESFQELRRQSGKSYQAIGQAVGRPRSTVSGWFSGRHLPLPREADDVTAVLAFLGVDDPAPWLDALDRARSYRDRAVVGNPYRGLEPFTEDSADYFFGRERAMAEVAERIATRLVSTTDRHLLVVGPSGVGKTSFLRAGLSSVCAERGWGYTYLQPFDPVTIDLTTVDGDSADGSDSADGDSADVDSADVDSADVDSADVDSVDSGDGDNGNGPTPSVVVIDQIEQLLVERHPRTGSRSDGSSPVGGPSGGASAAAGSDLDAGLAAIERLLDRPGTIGVLGLRADFFARAAEQPYLARLIDSGLHLLGPMTTSEVTDCIVKPAELARLTVADDLLVQLTADFRHLEGRDGAAALPLLSHLLHELADPAGAGSGLTLDCYRRLGGLNEAVNRTAEGVYQPLPPEDQAAARRLFEMLIEATVDAAPVRRVLGLDTLAEAEAADGIDYLEVAEPFVAGRLLTIDRDTIRIAHESLLTSWSRLGGWIDEVRSDLATIGRVRQASRAWLDTGRDRHALLAGVQLDNALAVDPSVAALRLGDDDLAFLDRSRRQRDAVERRRVMTQRAALAVAATMVVLAATAGLFAVRAVRATAESNSRLLALQAQKVQPNDPALSGQLALAAYRSADTVEARSALLDATSQIRSGRYLGDTGATALAATDDGDRVAYSSSVNGTVRVLERDGDHYVELDTLALADPEIDLYALAFSPDGERLVLGGTDHRVSLWTVGSDAPPIELDDSLARFDGATQSVVFSHDGSFVLGATRAAGIGRWDLSPDGADPVPSLLPLRPEPEEVIVGLSLDATDRHLAVMSDSSRLSLWDLTSDAATPLWSGEAEEAATVGTATAISPDGAWVAAGYRSGMVRLWRIDDPSAPEEVELPDAKFGSWVNSLSFSPDGSMLAAGSSDATARVWSTADQVRLGPDLSHPTTITQVRLTGDGRLLTATFGGELRTWDLTGPAFVPMDASVWTSMFSADGSSLLSGSAVLFRTWDTDGDVPVGGLPILEGQVEGLGLLGGGVRSVDGRYAVYGTREGPLLWTDTTRPGVIDRIDGFTSPTIQQLISPNGDALIAVGETPGRLQLWRIAGDGSTIEAGSLEITALGQGGSVSPDGDLVAMTDADGMARLIDITDLDNPVELSAVLTGESYAVSSMFHPTKPYLAVGNTDSTTTIWDITDRSAPVLVSRITGPRERITNIDYDATGDRLAALSADSRVWMWDVADPARPEPIAALDTSPSRMFVLDFDPRGRWLAAGGTSGFVSFWDLDQEKAAATVCAGIGDPISADEWELLAPGLDYDPPCSG